MAWDPDDFEQQVELEMHYDDVPTHLLGELEDWLTTVLLMPGSGTKGYRVRAILNLLRITAREPSIDWRSMALSKLIHQCRADSNLMLETISLTLREFDPNGRTSLETILRRGRSAYRVRADGRWLEHRVDPASRESIERAVSEVSPTVSTCLTRAWNAAYGITPEPDVAAHAAFQAAEAALRPVICPQDSAAGLHKIIRTYEDNPTKWEMAVTEARPSQFRSGPRFAELDGSETVMQLARTIAHGQRGRHADGEGDNHGVPDARAIVQCAIAIVMMVNDGAFRLATP
ncbi:hypothetical protein [Nocardioides sp. R-C-SC26]|uniref:hypothetical protein n=1 Tax=Nocardioides sp. R-C-SC26 TaxID=2870414 RepID=UPI001E64C4EF|nr:hypothetical protein [Nocardioides sp. R-C-SC26]